MRPPTALRQRHGGYYTVVVTLHINDKAVSGRFAKAAGTNK